VHPNKFKKENTAGLSSADRTQYSDRSGLQYSPVPNGQVMHTKKSTKEFQN
jgi:hypothetical protein